MLILASTPFEIQSFIDKLPPSKEGIHQMGEMSIEPMITGVGMVNTAIALTMRLSVGQKPEFVVHAGIGGAYKRDLALGTVVNVVSERFADLGAEEKDGTLLDLFDLGFVKPDGEPFKNKILLNEAAASFDFLPKANGLTVAKASGTADTINRLLAKYPDATVESMEGAVVSYLCQLFDVPFLSIRAISNYVEPRNRDAWNLPLALGNLNEALFRMTNAFQ